MGKYLVLIYGDEQRWAQASEHWQRGNADGHRVFNAGAGSAVLGGNELEPTASAVSMRPDAAGRPSRTDGPFLETKEVIGGYYLLQAADMDEAIELAGRIPEATTPFSGVEIRPVVESG
ncbi:MAG: hypothetical protein DLM58_08530 [Pseudonocardiales bacterium]|nr:MAG: hypothetical protein DLM58_08530 [Pseudonocardiales bacterium]